jgi:predicted PurR-regulated permease PerM
VLTIAMLYFAKPVFMPLALAGMFALVFLPMCRLLENKGCSNVVASILCGFFLALLITGVILFVVWNVRHVAADFSDIKEHFSGYLHGFRKYLHDQFGMDTLKKDSPLPIPVQPNADGIGRMATVVLSILFSLIIDLLLILIYMVMLLCLRHKIRIFILKILPLEARGRYNVVISRSARVVQQYLGGLAVVIACLWIMYTIGFSLVGVNSPVFFAILCGLLEIVPFVGNITGSTLTCLMALSQGGGFKMVLGVLVTYALIQFIQFYIISPLVMRTQLSIHPLFTILVLLAGDLVWGIPGMILAIPALGILKIVCDNVESLHAFGQLLGENRPPRRLFSLRKARSTKN